MKKVILFSAFVISSFGISAQNKSNKLFETATIAKIDTSIKGSFTDIANIIGALFGGRPMDSIVDMGSKTILYSGNYRIILNNREDYSYYLTQAVEYAIFVKETRLKIINSPYRHQQQQRPQRGNQSVGNY